MILNEKDVPVFEEKILKYHLSYKTKIESFLEKFESEHDEIMQSSYFLDLYNYLMVLLLKKCFIQNKNDVFLFIDESNKLQKMDIADKVLILSISFKYINYDEYFEIYKLKEIRNNNSLAHFLNTFNNCDEYITNTRKIISLINDVESRTSKVTNFSKSGLEEHDTFIFLIKKINENNEVSDNDKRLLKMIEYIDDNSKEIFLNCFLQWMLYPHIFLNSSWCKKILKKINSNGKKRILNFIFNSAESKYFKLITIDKLIMINYEYFSIYEDNINSIIETWKKEEGMYYEFSDVNNFLNTTLFKNIVIYWRIKKSSNIMEFYEWILNCPSGIAWSITNFEKIMFEEDIYKQILKNFYQNNQNLCRKSRESNIYISEELLKCMEV